LNSAYATAARSLEAKKAPICAWIATSTANRLKAGASGSGVSRCASDNCSRAWSASCSNQSATRSGEYLMPGSPRTTSSANSSTDANRPGSSALTVPKRLGVGVSGYGSDGESWTMDMLV
jgi:hypothetical protein